MRGSRPERDESPGKMAAAGSSEPGCPPCPAASRAPAMSGAGLVLSPPDYEEKFSACVEGQSDCRPPPAHPASGTQRHICFGLHRRSDPEKSSTQPGRKDCDSRRGQCGHHRRLAPRSAPLDYIGGQASTLVQVQPQQKAQFSSRTGPFGLLTRESSDEVD